MIGLKGKIKMVERKAQVKICPCCNQKIRKSAPYTLSRIHIKYLFKFYKLQLETGNYYVTDNVYGLVKKCSPTTMNTQLKYLGAVEKYFDSSDVGKVNSGKWRLTEKGLKFLKEEGTLPSCVIVKDGRVIESQQEYFITDKRIKWKTEEDIWMDIKSYWSGEKNEN